MERRAYDAGDVLIREGDPSDFVYRILSGRVEIFTEYGGQTVYALARVSVAQLSYAREGNASNQVPFLRRSGDA
jgi:CRP-like cAMP-binding protein